ncbi:heparinase II/III family protein [Jeotgalicoccus halotolerans]|uniref:heparinase II/III domain-containing protein n=1 Tax=Jeotgalicoccus halotolerans TaxID=157227 RepID=UPI003515626D
MNARTKEHIKVSNLLLDNKLRVKKDFDDIDITNGINWEYQHDVNAKTYQVYLHSLNILKSLVITSKELDDSRYLEAAEEHLKEWLNGEFNQSNSQAWHEHAVSARLQNIIYYQQRAKSFNLDRDSFQKLLLEHCKFLSEKSNYQENNHGIMMDNALIFASNSLDNDELKQSYLEIAYYRVKMALFRDFSKMGVHLENSPEYHKMVLNLYSNIAKNLSAAKMPLGKEISGLFNRARVYSGQMIKPDNTLPIIGDSSKYEETIVKKYTDFVDHEAGVIISQYKDHINVKNSSWLYFKSGYMSKTHKHRDDLSISLYMNGHDILVDSGKYGYNLKDPIRKYIVSPQAHSTVYYRNSDYELTNPYSDQIKLKTNRFENRGKYKLSTGINNLYKEGGITRSAILTKEKVLIVFDRFVTKDFNTGIQNFNVTENAIITQVDDNKFKIEIDEKSYILESVDIGYNSPKGRICDGYISYKFGQVIQNKRIEFATEAKNFGMLTFLYENKEDLKIDNIIKKANEINFDLNFVKQSIRI